MNPKLHLVVKRISKEWQAWGATPANPTFHQLASGKTLPELMNRVQDLSRTGLVADLYTGYIQ